MWWSRSESPAVLAAVLSILNHVTLSQYIFSQTLRAGIPSQTERQNRAIASPSSKDDSPLSFVVQMPFTVVSGDTKVSTHDDDWARPSIETVQEENNPTLVSLGETGQKINFYTIKCTSGELCSSIIPAQVVTSTPSGAEKMTHEQMKRYLKDLNLVNGFGFSDSGRNDKSLKYFEDEKILQENSRKARQRSFHDVRDNSDFWPGSHLRPNRDQAASQTFTANGEQDFDAFGGRSFTDLATLSSMSESWPRGVHIFTRNANSNRAESGRKISSQIPSPTFGNVIDWPYSFENEAHSPRFYRNKNHQVSNSVQINSNTNNKWTAPDNYKYNSKIRPGGEWRKFSTSTVAQLDKNSGKWTKVSKNTVDVNPDLPSNYKPGINPSIFHSWPATSLQNEHNRPGESTTMQHTSTGLTVLGVTESNIHQPTAPTIETSSGNSGYYPNRPWGNYHNEATAAKPASTNHSDSPQRPMIPVSALTHVSHPLYVLPADPLSTPVSIADPGTALALAQAAALTTTVSTTQRAARTTQGTTTTEKPAGGGGGGGGSILSNPYALVAAVGAGLIPATFAALLPVFLGKRRKRRSTINDEPRRFEALSPAFSPKLPEIANKKFYRTWR